MEFVALSKFKLQCFINANGNSWSLTYKKEKKVKMFYIYIAFKVAYFPNVQS